MKTCLNKGNLFFIFLASPNPDVPFHLGEKEPKSPCPVEEIGEIKSPFTNEPVDTKDRHGSLFVHSRFTFPLFFSTGEKRDACTLMDFFYSSQRAG